MVAAAPVPARGRHTGVTSRRRGAFLIVHLEETRICVDVLRPQPLHHRLHFTGPIILAIRQHVSKLAWVQSSGVRCAGMRSVFCSGRRMGNALRGSRTGVDIRRSIQKEAPRCFSQPGGTGKAKACCRVLISSPSARSRPGVRTAHRERRTVTLPLCLSFYLVLRVSFICDRTRVCGRTVLGEQTSM